MRILIPIICLIVYICSSDTAAATFGVSDTNLWGAFSYHLFHASWLHLALNALCYYLMYKPVCARWYARFRDNGMLINMYFAAVFASMFAAQDIPTVGLSGIIFAMLGALLALNPTLKQLQNYIYVGLAVLFQLFFGHSNVALHIFAFIFGALAVVIRIAADTIQIKETE